MLLSEVLGEYPVNLLDKLAARLFFGLLFGLLFGLSLGMINGGEVCIKHLTLRILLCFNKSIPWDYARFLDYCTERLFLQRVGGRYRFIHKLLQDHFARMPLDN